MPSLGNSLRKVEMRNDRRRTQYLSDALPACSPSLFRYACETQCSFVLPGRTAPGSQSTNDCLHPHISGPELLARDVGLLSVLSRRLSGSRFWHGDTLSRTGRSTVGIVCRSYGTVSGEVDGVTPAFSPVRQCCLLTGFPPSHLRLLQQKTVRRTCRVTITA